MAMDRTKTISITIDSEINELAEKRAKELGRPLEEEIHDFLIRFAQDEEELSEYGKQLLREAEDEIARGEYGVQFGSAEEYLQYLDSLSS